MIASLAALVILATPTPYQTVTVRAAHYDSLVTKARRCDGREQFYRMASAAPSTRLGTTRTSAGGHGGAAFSSVSGRVGASPAEGSVSRRSSWAAASQIARHDTSPKNGPRRPGFIRRHRFLVGLVVGTGIALAIREVQDGGDRLVALPCPSCPPPDREEDCDR